MSLFSATRLTERVSTESQYSWVPVSVSGGVKSANKDQERLLHSQTYQNKDGAQQQWIQLLLRGNLEQFNIRFKIRTTLRKTNTDQSKFFDPGGNQDFYALPLRLSISGRVDAEKTVWLLNLFFRCLLNIETRFLLAANQLFPYVPEEIQRYLM